MKLKKTGLIRMDCFYRLRIGMWRPEELGDENKITI
jgi:hypothetical protein